jgi:uncharacterized protein
MQLKVFLVSLILISLLASCSADNAPNASRPCFIIDSHIQYRATDEWEKSFIDTYTLHNAMGCVMIPMEHLERGIRFALDHPERVIPYAQIDMDSPTITRDIRKVRAMGYRGLGKLTATGHWSYDDPRYDSIWILAREFGMPVAVHTGIHPRGNFARMRPACIAAVASRHRDLFIHAAHFGNPWYAEAGEAARLNPNLFFDISGSPLVQMDHDPGYWKQFLWWTDRLGQPHVGIASGSAWEKILFATNEGPDGLVNNIVRFNKMLDACSVPEETRANMYGLTIARAHGIAVD